MMDPKVLLLDEPTSALDPTMVAEVLAVIRMLAKQGLTMLIVTHEMKFAQEVSDRILFFADRASMNRGHQRKFLSNPGEIRRLPLSASIRSSAMRLPGGQSST
jgi:polar amino acid transport system ATP-binding protein